MNKKEKGQVIISAFQNGGHFLRKWCSRNGDEDRTGCADTPCIQVDPQVLLSQAQATEMLKNKN